MSQKLAIKKDIVIISQDFALLNVPFSMYICFEWDKFIKEITCFDFTIRPLAELTGWLHIANRK